jgi:hypothetical protein
VEAFPAAWNYDGSLYTAAATRHVVETYRAVVFRIRVVNRQLAQTV